MVTGTDEVKISSICAFSKSNDDEQCSDDSGIHRYRLPYKVRATPNDNRMYNDGKIIDGKSTGKLNEGQYLLQNGSILKVLRISRSRRLFWFCALTAFLTSLITHSNSLQRLMLVQQEKIWNDIEVTGSLESNHSRNNNQSQNFVYDNHTALLLTNRLEHEDKDIRGNKNNVRKAHILNINNKTASERATVVASEDINQSSKMKKSIETISKVDTLKGDKNSTPKQDFKVIEKKNAAVTATSTEGDGKMRINEKSKYKKLKRIQKRTKQQPRDHPHAGARDADGYFGYVPDVKLLHTFMIEEYCQFVLKANSTVAINRILRRNEETTNHQINLKHAQQSFRCSIPLNHSTESDNDSTSANEYDEVCNVEPGIGFESNGWHIVANILDPIDEGLMLNKSMPSILCAIYTYDEMHDTMVRAVVETWGWKCDGFFAASNRAIGQPQSKHNIIHQNDTDSVSHQVSHATSAMPYAAVIDLVHEGPEAYGNMWQKTRSILSFMYDNFLNDFDYFYLSGDDTHLIVENLKLYLYNFQQQQDIIQKPQSPYDGENNTSDKTTYDKDNFAEQRLLLGQSMKYQSLGIFLGGGGGYVLSRGTLRHFVEVAIPNCHPHDVTSMEDVYVGRCLNSSTWVEDDFVPKTDFTSETSESASRSRRLTMIGDGVGITDGVDEEGRQRFHGVPPSSYMDNSLEDGFYKTVVQQHWPAKYGYKKKHSLVSPTSISFHSLSPPLAMKRHHAILYSKNTNIDNIDNSGGVCPAGTILADALTKIMLEKGQQVPTNEE